MQASQPSLIMRDDTLLGVCQGIGEDFGFSPNWLRIIFAAVLIWNPVAAFAAYLGLGVVVAIARLLFPNPKPAPAAASSGCRAPAGSAAAAA